VQAQELNSYLGKIIRITTTGKPAAGNPFANQSNAKPEIISYGHRNPEGLDIDPATGELWEAEFGPHGGDEINLIRPVRTMAGRSSLMVLSTPTTRSAKAFSKRQEWNSRCIIGILSSHKRHLFLQGNCHSEWKNNLFVACLSGQHVDRLIIRNNRVVGEERLLGDKNQRFRDVTYSNNVLYAITDDGDIYRIEPEAKR